MFVRKKPNKNGLISVQIIDKSSGKYVVRQTVGSSTDLAEIALLIKKGKQEILKGQTSLPF